MVYLQQEKWPTRYRLHDTRHTQRMLQCNSTISTTNKSRLPPNGVVVLPAFYPLLFLLFKVMYSTRAVLHNYLSISPGTPGSSKPKWQWRAQPSFLSSKPALTGTRGWHLLQQGWTQAPMVPAALGRAPGNSNPLLTGGQFATELGTETAPFHTPIGGSNIPFNIAAQQQRYLGCTMACEVLHLLLFLLS